MRTMFLDMNKFRGRHVDVMHEGKKVGFARVCPDGVEIVLEDDRLKRLIASDQQRLSFSIGGKVDEEVQGS